MELLSISLSLRALCKNYWGIKGTVNWDSLGTAAQRLFSVLDWNVDGQEQKSLKGCTVSFKGAEIYLEGWVAIVCGKVCAKTVPGGLAVSTLALGSALDPVLSLKSWSASSIFSLSLSLTRTLSVSLCLSVSISISLSLYIYLYLCGVSDYGQITF